MSGHYLLNLFKFRFLISTMVNMEARGWSLWLAEEAAAGQECGWDPYDGSHWMMHLLHTEGVHQLGGDIRAHLYWPWKARVEPSGELAELQKSNWFK